MTPLHVVDGCNDCLGSNTTHLWWFYNGQMVAAEIGAMGLWQHKKEMVSGGVPPPAKRRNNIYSTKIYTFGGFYFVA